MGLSADDIQQTERSEKSTSEIFQSSAQKEKKD
jgi:hypothetical protein